MGSKKRGREDSDDSDCDLLKHLNEAHQAAVHRVHEQATQDSVSVVKTDNSDTASESSDSDDLLAFLDDERRKELNRLRKRKYMNKLKSSKDKSASKHLETKNASSGFENELSAEERTECLEHLRRALGAEGLDECACVVCDRLGLRQESRRVEDVDLTYLKKMKRSLHVETANLPNTLVEQYRCPSCLSDLSGLMVSPRGINTYTDDNNYSRAWLSVCRECDRSIQRGRLPKFAIANGFFVGRLPHKHRDLTVPERLMTQLTNVVAMTRVMRGGHHRCIRSHCIAFDCTPGPPVTLLPRSLEDVASYRVVLIGDFTAAQLEQVRKLHRIRNGAVRDLFAFYKINNHLYAEIAESDPAENSEYTDADLEAAFVEYVPDDEGSIGGEMDREQQNIRGESDAWRVMCKTNECSVLERRIGLANTGTPVAVRELPVLSQAGRNREREREFEVRRSSFFANDISGTLLARIFPELFPFGRGHPGEQRHVKVSVQECIKYYTMLSERQFAEDALFTLVAFDKISMMSMYIQNHVRCQRFPHLLEGYDRLTSEQLGKALLENERRLQGCLPWRQADNSVAQKFLKTVEIGSRSVWGSNAERSQCRHKAFAYQTRFGQPALFVTLTPNSDNSLVLAHYTGVLSVDSLFDLLEARLPTKAELREASRENDCASARLFMRHVDAFIRHALGIDPRTRKKLSYRGLLGDVKAYFGMVESQGRGTLHIHLLIWLNHCPPNSTAVMKILGSPQGNVFRERVASYADSIVQNDLPISLDNYNCSSCGASHERLIGLQIPEQARKDPTGRSTKNRSRYRPAEPALVACGRCGAQFSSQHLIRNALLKARPECWPIWRQPLSPNEIEQQAVAESVCRSTKKKAVDIICDRESVHASYCCDLSIREREKLTADLLHQANHRQMPLCKADDDPFRNDTLARLLEISPPSTSDARMAQQAQDYMVASLAVLQNQHLWCHTTSCFKNSRVTKSDTYCRHRFPRCPVPGTSFQSSGVELKRTLGHEFINGFNYELMATFKCNHDIQVLLGGIDTTERIHYCCKYIAKPQKQLESQVAVAVAALKRREARENAEHTTTATGVDRLTMSRRRVAGMIYNLTNRQEIAGPLAALYLYHGSCCYSSARCVSLPLGDVVRQLMELENYSCNLVNSSEDATTSNFRAVSYLDDYIYRPKMLENLNLYEFTMWFFRKKHENAISLWLGFLDRHPLCKSHCLGKRYEEVVPVLQTFRFPRNEGQASSEKRYKYAVLSLVLFKPFRCLADLVSHSSDEQMWIDCYDQWKPQRSNFVEEIMNNMEDFYSGFERAKSAREEASVTSKPESLTPDGDTSGDENDDLFHGDELDFDDFVMEEDNQNRDLGDLWTSDDNIDAVLESMDLDPASCPTTTAPDDSIAPMLGIFRDCGLLKPAAQNILESDIIECCLPDSLSIDLMKKWVKDDNTDNALLATCEPRSGLVTQKTEVVELLDGGLLESNMTWQPPLTLACSPKLTKNFATISDTSKTFSLNKRQHYAFTAIGKALLSRWRQAETLPGADISLSLCLRQTQLLLFLGGEGGTGKSRIIDAVQAFCDSWGRQQSLIKTALTGKAATLIEGRTLAAFLLQLRKKRATDEIINLELIIIDEVSMMRKFQLAQLDKILRIAKRMPDVAFGGVHIVLVGDFLQLPPVGGAPLFKDPSTQAKLSSNELAGFALWRQFTNVVILKESVRFAKDPEWGRGCHQARLGTWTPEFVDLINSRVLTAASTIDAAANDEKATTFVTPDNSTRTAINHLFVSTTAKLLPHGEYPVRVVANFKGKLSSLRRSEVRDIMSLPDTKFGRLAPYLDLIIGMPVQITQNVRPAKLVANGTLGRLETILYHPDTQFRLVHDSEADMTVKVPSIPPPAVLVRIDRGPAASTLLGYNDANLFPLFFDTEAYNACNISLAGFVNGIPRSLSVKIQQFPLACAVSCTIYKVQGDTLDAMVVTDWRSKCAQTNKREQPYLLVSRVTSRSAFTALKPLTNDIIQWAKPSQATLDEEARLKRFSADTIKRLKARVE